MIIEFHKYHGTGNDFVIIDETKSRAGLDKDTIIRLCDRHTGIGGDGLISIKKIGEEEFRMEYYNSDGSTGTLCGNGGRCAAALADYLTVRPADHFTLIASDGTHFAQILSRLGNSATVKFSLLDVSEIRKSPAGLVLNTGSPHLVLAIDNLDDLDVEGEGRKLRFAPEFSPEGINVNFADFSNDRIRVRTYERGVEKETLSCGTGVTAAALAFAHSRKIDSGPIEVVTNGGVLTVDFNRTKEGIFKNISLEGPAVKVFSGHVELWNIRKKN